MRLVIRVVLLVLFCTAAWAAERIHDEVISTRFLSHSLLVDDGAFEKAALHARATRFMHAVSGRYAFAELFLARTRAEFAEATAKGATDIDWEWWLRDYNAQRQKPFPVARITVVGDQCSIETRNKKGEVALEVIGTRNPRIVATARGTYELLNVSAWYVRADERIWYGDHIRADAQVRSLKPLSGVDIELWLLLAKLVGTKSLDLTVREDHWFIEEMSFPFVYPFLPAGPPPGRTLDPSESLFACDGDIHRLHCISASGGVNEDREYGLDGTPRSKPRP